MAYSKIIYRTDVSTGGKEKAKKIHLGLADIPFKERYRDHRRNFNTKSTRIVPN